MTQTYDERREARQDRIDDRADKLRSELTSLWNREKAISDHIPFGQPILVGHHSQRRHENDIAKLRSLADKTVAAYRELEKVEASDATTAILASDSDAVEQLRAKIEKAEALQVKVKATNILARKGDLAGLAAMGYSEKAIDGLMKPDWGKPGVPAYVLSNNNANIRIMKERLAHLERVKSAAPVEREIAGVRIQEDPEAVRLRLIFPGKPSPEIIAELKSRCFRWAPSEGAWQRQLSSAARWAAGQIIAKLS